MAAVAQDGPARLLGAAVRVMPAGRRDWGRAMQAELAALEGRAERRGFAWSCLRAAAVQCHLLRGVVHVLVMAGVLGTLLAWAATVDYQPLTWVLSAVLLVLTAVSWQARRAGLLGPTGDGVTAWLLRAGGYLVAVAIAAVAVAHARPATLAAADAGIGVLVLSTIAASFLIGLISVRAKRSTPRVLITGLGSGLAAAAGWVAVVLVAPPIPATVGWALAATAVAASAAVLANAGRAGTAEAGLLATATTLASIFVGVLLLARWGPDSIIPAITPHALPANRISESRVEIVDPYVLIVVLAGVAATVLSLAAVTTRRPVSGRTA